MPQRGPSIVDAVTGLDTRAGPRQRSARRLGALGLVAGLCAAAPSAAEVQIAVDARAPLVMMVISPPGVRTATPSSALLALAGAALEPRTGLLLRSLEQAGVDESQVDACASERRFTCWVKAVDRHRGAGPSPRYLLVLVAHPAGEARARLISMLVDLEAATRAYRDADHRDPAWAEAVESRIFAVTIRTSATTVDLADRAALAQYFVQLFERDLRSPLERAGQWRPFSEVTIESAAAGLPIRVDGRLVGVTQAGLTRLIDFVPGSRQVVVDRANGDAERFDLTLTAGQVEQIRTTAAPLPMHAARSAVLWGGVASAVVGVAVGAAAGIIANDGLSSVCLVRAGASAADCPKVGTPTAGHDPDAAPALAVDTVNPAGVALAPLAAALIAAGGGWALGAGLLGPADDVPWWSIAIGVLAGGAAYGIGAALAAQ